MKFEATIEFGIVNDEIILLYIYDKNEMENLNDDFIRYLLQPFK